MARRGASRRSATRIAAQHGSARMQPLCWLWKALAPATPPVQNPCLMPSLSAQTQQMDPRSERHKAVTPEPQPPVSAGSHA
eukprot:8065745-Alexandrium_andersonii.AAC.1